MIQHAHPQWRPDQDVCQTCLNQGKASYMQGVLEAELESLSPLEHQVLNSIRNGELISTVSLNGFERERSQSERLADRFTAAIGNWCFPSTVLASLAALEGPIILMSQRRQAKRDRLRAINDYRVNLKAELEIRYLNEKIDHWLTNQKKPLSELGIAESKKSARIQSKQK